MIKTGLYFGSFNPIHVGHMAIANYMVEYTDIDQLWFVVSPQNPLKKKKTLLDDYQRLELVNRAIGDDLRFRASKVEFGLPKPSYTIDTLAHLSEKYPTHQFFILMGSDNLESIHKWKNADVLLANYDIIVYPRPGFNPEMALKYPAFRWPMRHSWKFLRPSSAIPLEPEKISDISCHIAAGIICSK